MSHYDTASRWFFFFNKDFFSLGYSLGNIWNKEQVATCSGNLKTITQVWTIGSKGHPWFAQLAVIGMM